MMIRCRMLLTGKVQGVFFRKFVKDNAEDLGLSGWVRNRDDGRVEVLAEGKEEDVEELIDLCSRGPPAAEVEDIETKKEKHIGNLKGFTISYS